MQTDFYQENENQMKSKRKALPYGLIIQKTYTNRTHPESQLNHQTHQLCFIQIRLGATYKRCYNKVQMRTASEFSLRKLVFTFEPWDLRQSKQMLDQGMLGFYSSVSKIPFSYHHIY